MGCIYLNDIWHDWKLRAYTNKDMCFDVNGLIITRSPVNTIELSLCSILE